jgi:glycosyltransferase involved in cell wall biosynthesis
MRVLMTADTVGGVFTHALALATGLRGEQTEVALATFGRPMSAEQRRRVRDSGAELVLESSLGLEWMPDPWADVQAAEELLLDLERSLRPDVVHLNGFAHGAAPWQAPVLVAGHSCVCSWWAAVHGQAPPASWSRYCDAVRRGMGGADAVAAPTEAMLAELKRWHGPLPAVSRAILNGIGYAGPEVAPAKRPVALSAGRLWDQAKNAAALARVAGRPRLRDRVVLAGEGDAAGDVRLLGPLDPAELARVRRAAAVYAAPALYEPFGLGILEAARDHCALVLGDIASLRELWDGAAVFVAPDDDERLAGALERLLGDPAAAAALGERARQRAGRYTVSAMTAGYQALYRRVIRLRNPVAA